MDLTLDIAKCRAAAPYQTGYREYLEVEPEGGKYAQTDVDRLQRRFQRMERSAVTEIAKAISGAKRTLLDYVRATFDSKSTTMDWVGKLQIRKWDDVRAAFREMSRMAFTAGRRDLRREVATAAAFADWDEAKHPRQPSGSDKGGEFAPQWGQSESMFPDDELADPVTALVAYVGGGLLLEDPGEGLQIARDALRRSFEKFPKEAAAVKREARATLDKIAPNSETVELYHVSSSSWSTFRDRGGFDAWRSFTYDKGAALKLLNDLGGQGWVYTVKVPKTFVGAVVKYNDPNITEHAWQKEVLTDKAIPLNAIMRANQYRSKKQRTALHHDSFAQPDFAEFADPITPLAAARFMDERIFWISGVLRDDLTKRAQSVLARAIQYGESMDDVIGKLADLFAPYVLEGVAPEVVSPFRLETIVRTNLTEAYNTGRLEELGDPEIDPFIKGVRYSAILDERTTPICEFLHDKVFHQDDPNLDRLAPPNHFNCRSVLVPVMVGEEVEEFATEAEISEALDMIKTGFGGNVPEYAERAALPKIYATLKEEIQA